MSATPPPRPLASVVIPRRGPLAALRPCLAALARHTPPPWELVIVDDGSDPEVAAYLRGLADATAFPVLVVAAPAGAGCEASAALGIAAARGGRLALLGDDVVVGDGWLDQLAALLDSAPAIGVVGPMSNALPAPQLVPEAAYDGPETMREFASDWRSRHLGKWFTAPRVSAGCLLADRRVVEVLAALGEGPIGGEALASGAGRAGFASAVALDLFVHRFAAPGDASAPAADRTPDARWTADSPPRQAPPPTASPPRVAGRRLRVSLTMIVRDEEANLPACLASAAGLFDEVVVVDTGSRDRTREVARAFGARVGEFPWVDDFAAARNAALELARGDYAFWLDADDRVEPAEHRRLAALLGGLERPDAAYVVRCACDPAPGEAGLTVVDHVRLFPLRPDVRWSYRVHEQVMPALRRAGVPVRWSEATVRHVGYAEPGLRRRKLDRDRAILEAELAARPGEPFVLFNLGQVALERGEAAAALGYLLSSLAASHPADSITLKLHALVASCHQKLGDLAAAAAACEAGLRDGPDDAELLFRRGVLYRLAGEPGPAGECLRRVLTLRPPERFSSVDAGIYGHLTRRNLAELAEESGDVVGAAAQWSGVLAERPGDPSATRALARLAGR